jgi:hypothetical protein
MTYLLAVSLSDQLDFVVPEGTNCVIMVSLQVVLRLR